MRIFCEGKKAFQFSLDDQKRKTIDNKHKRYKEKGDNAPASLAPANSIPGRQ